jgi:DNA-directed RNA polymerase subunit RPC12/RpoP
MRYTCRKCKQEKDESEFFRHPATKTGYRLNACKRCSAKHLVDARRKKKKHLVKYKGGACQICGYDRCLDALDFHHCLGEKEQGLSRAVRGKLQAAKAEADKCVLLCNRCHKEVHAGMTDLEVAPPAGL